MRGSRRWKAHRWAYHSLVGPIPEGQVVRHKCDNPSCVRLDHLELGAQRDNLLDRRDRSRYHKLTRADVDAIKLKLPQRSQRQIAAAFGISQRMVGHIKAGRQWN